MLDQEAECDIILSTLTPEYIRDNAKRRSDRDIQYVALPTLFEGRFGQRECLQFANRIIAEIGTAKLNIHEKRLFRNFYLLYSGQPTSLQTLCFRMKRKIDWEELKNGVLFHNNNNIVAFLFKLHQNLYIPYGYAINIPEFALETFVFSTPSIATIVQEGFQEQLLQRNILLYGNGLNNGEFIVGIQARGLFELSIHSNDEWKE